MLKRYDFTLCVAVLLVFCGCKQSSKHSVQGTIHVAGKVPAHGTVTLTNGKNYLTGKVQPDGAFVLQLGPNLLNLAGEYRVLLNPPPLETTTDPTNGEIRANGKIDDKLFPPKYRVLESTDATQKLADGDNNLKIDLP